MIALIDAYHARLRTVGFWVYFLGAMVVISLAARWSHVSDALAYSAAVLVGLAGPVVFEIPHLIQLLRNGLSPASPVAELEAYEGAPGQLEALADVQGDDERPGLIEAAEHGDAGLARGVLRRGARRRRQVTNGPHFATSHPGLEQAPLADALPHGGSAAQEDEGHAALMEAAEHGHAALVRALLQRGEDPRAWDASGRTALHLAAIAGHAGVVEALLAADPQLVDLPGVQGRTALMDAAEQGHVELVRDLLKRGADPRRRMADGQSALNMAAAAGHFDVVDALLDCEPELVDLPEDEAHAASQPAHPRGLAADDLALLPHTGSVEDSDPLVDPLAEADFNISYGLYDVTIELLLAAIERAPARRDLRLKLLDVYFESGNREEFLLLAQDLSDNRHQAGPGEWEKISVMGRQLVPHVALFAPSPGRDAAGRVDLGVDLDLESGENALDYDVFEPGQADARAAEFVELPEDDAPAPAMSALERELERALDWPFMTVDQPAAAVDPTVAPLDTPLEAPLHSFEDEALESRANHVPSVAALDGGSGGVAKDATPWQAPAFEEEQQEQEPQAAQSPGGWPVEDSTASLTRADTADTAELATLDPVQLDPVELGRLELGKGGLDIDLDLYDNAYDPSGTAAHEHGLPGDTQALDEDDSGLPDVEPVTMSEVGTKLDLARAYVDVGDTEGACYILEEVLSEGSLEQKQEAQQLLDSLGTLSSAPAALSRPQR